jgi:isoleucyl-tRNA synthetase
VTETRTTERYRQLPSDLTGDALEREVMERWTRDGVFAASQALRADAPAWTFYEGPPTANGKPGIHHVFARTVKDLFCRHRAMLGYHVPRKAGWDTHGLPVEIEVEKQLGISGKQDIERSAWRSSIAAAAKRVDVQGRLGAGERAHGRTGWTTAIHTSRTRTTYVESCLVGAADAA